MTTIQNVLKLIPADELHWCKEEKRFTLLSDQELKMIITDCMLLLGIEDTEDMMPYVDALAFLKMGGIMFNRYVNGNISFTGMEQGDLTWVAIEHDD